MTGAHLRARARDWRPNRAVVVLAVAAAMLSYALVVLGSTVRVTNSGMGCPSWPLCYGHAGPVDQYNALLEQSHRYLVSLVTVAVLATAALAYRSTVRHTAVVPAAIGAGLIVVQAGLGAVTVFAHNAPWTVAVHLIVGFVFFGVTAVTAVAAVRARSASWSAEPVGAWGWFALAATLMLVVAGTLVVATGAGDDCPSWPLCTQTAPDGLVAWQLVHRALAGVAGLSLVGLGLGAGRKRRRWLAGTVLCVIAGIVALQAGCGSASSTVNTGGGTVAGTYNITINGSAGTGQSHSGTPVSIRVN